VTLRQPGRRHQSFNIHLHEHAQKDWILTAS
jgi:hypothetical protein